MSIFTNLTVLADKDYTYDVERVHYSSPWYIYAIFILILFILVFGIAYLIKYLKNIKGRSKWYLICVGLGYGNETDYNCIEWGKR